MKLFGKLFFRLACGIALVAPMVTSCYDDSKLWDEIYMINSTISEMRNSLNGQIKALDELIKGGSITISECKRKSDGTYMVTLSNGTQFNVLHSDKSLKGMVSYIEVAGEKCWAAYDETGKLTLLQNSDKEYIPVQAAVPYIEERDGFYYLIVGDEEYKTGFDFDTHSVITDCTMNTDDSGNTHSVTFSFGEGLTFTVPVDGYKGFTFRLANNVISDLYVDYASTYQISAGLDGVVDYVMQIPDGWRVKERTDDSTGKLYLDITAPSQMLVDSGAAVEEGQLKVVAVVEGGDAMVARLELTTDPFKTFTVTATNAIIEPHNGVDKYLYGLTTEFDQDAIFAEAESMLNDNDASNVATAGMNVLLSQILGAEVEAGAEYTLWAIPVFYEMDGEEAGYYVKDGLIETCHFGGSKVTLEVDDVRFNDAFITYKLEGATSYYAGTALKEDELVENILYQINNDLVDPVSDVSEYAGSAFDFPTPTSNQGVTPESKATYVTWMVPHFDYKEVYTADDIISVEFTLSDVSGGGEVTVSFGEPIVDRTTISVPMSAENGTRLYYVFLTEPKAKSIKNEADRASYLLENGKVIDAGSGEAYVDMVNPATKRVLFAMATDEYGKYGPVTTNIDAPFQTDPLVFNDLKVTATTQIETVGQTKAKVAVDVTGGEAVDYVYWVGRETDEFWIKMEKKIANIERHLALYPEEFEKMKYNYPIEDGIMNLTELRGESKYHVVVLAKDGTKDDKGNDKYSKCASCEVETLAADLGTIVRENSDEWNNAKSQIEITWHADSFTLPENSNMTAFYSFDIKCPTHLTAFILCASDNYFEENPDTQTVENRIIEVEAQCSRKYDAGKTVYDVNGESIQEPDWIDDSGQLHRGTMLNVYDFYVHGYPTNGFATYFAESVHGNEGACSTWVPDGCTNYKYALDHITRRHSLDYYIEHVKSVRGNKCKTEDTIRRVAQDLFNAYYPYYKDAKPLIYINDGSPLYMENHYASGVNEDGVVVDDVYVVLKDAAGNYYEPMKFDVPNYFKK